MLARIHWPHPSVDGQLIDITADEHHYLTRVLRARIGDRIELFDGRGKRCQGLIERLDRERAQVHTGTWLNQHPSGPLRIELIQGISAAQKMDWTIEKAIELGVHSIRPVTTELSQVRLDERRSEARHEHWQRLCLAACRQSGRDELPVLHPPAPLLRSLTSIGAVRSPARLLLSPPSSAGETPSLSSWWQSHAAHRPGILDVALLVGPESGLSSAEINAALDSAFVPVSLGALTLRTETAALAAVAALNALADHN